MHPPQKTSTGLIVAIIVAVVLVAICVGSAVALLQRANQRANANASRPTATIVTIDQARGVSVTGKGEATR
jgi:flagellar basal body-associated protein FliL